MSEKRMAGDLCAYGEELSRCLLATDWDCLDAIGEVWLFGNGGSAATASHVTNDLVKGCRVRDEVGFKAICLNDSSTLLTCLANDFSYADVYSILLKTYAKAGDVALAFSGSGNSPNVVNGLTAAKEIGMKTIGLGGRDGGKMKALCDIILIAPTYSMEMLEDLHLFYFHNLVCALRKQL